MQVPKDLKCADKTCAHPLSDHLINDQQSTELDDIKGQVHSCLFFERGTGTFAVCGCRDYELPTIETDATADDREVRRFQVTNTTDAEDTIMLVLWWSGRVTWTSSDVPF